MICRRCGARWAFGDEMSPLLLRRSHTCSLCGWVSERPARALAGFFGLFGALLVTSQPWAIRVAIAMLGVVCIQLVTHGASAEHRRTSDASKRR